MDARLVAVVVAIAITALSSSALALSLAPLVPSRTRTTSSTGTALGYMTHLDSYNDILDVDGDRMSLRALLDPPAAPREALATLEQETSISSRSNSSSSSSSSSRASQRVSPITTLRSIQDYQRHVLHEPNQLCIIRFSAPFCKVCRTTSVSWERMASKIHKMGAKRIKFLSVSVDGKDAATTALKDMLQVKRVPQGIIHHPTQGLFGQKVDLNRANLTALRKRLETYVGEEGAEGGILLDVGLHSLQ